MRVFASALVFILAGSAAAQEDLTVLKADGDVAPRKMLYESLRKEAGKHFDARRQAVAALKTADDVKRRQADLKARFVQSLGGFPERTPLNAKVMGTDQRDGYRVERVVYESRPNHHVTALLYLPVGKGPFPGVLLPCGHDATGKSAESYQRACILMATNGLAALCYDPIGQGERLQAIDSNGKTALKNGVTEHTLVGVGALLVGENTATYRIWDGMRSLDYLASRPEIDAKRLGCTGCSGGGTLTSYLMALDDRVVAAAPSCYITSLERLFATLGPQDAEQNITGQVAFGMEHADYLTMRAPRATLLCVASRDFFDQQGTWTTFREAKRVYGIVGHAERVDIAEFDTVHGYPKPQREAIVRFLRRWLLDKDDAIVEGDIAVVRDRDLHCTRTGQVLEDYKGKSAFDFNAERARSFTGQRGKFLADTANAEKQVHQLLGLPGEIASASVKVVGTVKREGLEIRKLAFETEPGISVPALLFLPEGKPGKRPLVLYAHGKGKGEDAAVGGAIEKLAKAGHNVLALDLRGMGETAPGTSPANAPDYWGVDAKEAFLGLHLNRPLLGQRVVDVLAIAAWAAKDEDLKGCPLHAIGIGAAGPAVLHAVALEPRIEEATLDRAVLSWSAVAHMPGGHGQLANAVPGVLKVYDLPDAAALLAPRPLQVLSPVDPAGIGVGQERLEEAYAACREVYAARKAEKRLVLKATK